MSVGAVYVVARDKRPRRVGDGSRAPQTRASNESAARQGRTRKFARPPVRGFPCFSVAKARGCWG